MIELKIDGGVAEVVLNAPQKLNALNAQALSDLKSAVDEAAAEASAGRVQALLLRGEGRAFCAGRDLAEVVVETDDALDFLEGKIVPAMRSIMDFPAPSFAAAQGASLGAGLGLLIAADVVYVAENAKIGSPFANLGMVLDSGGHWLFTERLGTHRTLDLIYTADLISGSEAVRSGLFSRAFPGEELLEQTRQIVARVAKGPINAYQDGKKLVEAIRDQRLGFWEALDLENKVQAAIVSTENYREGIEAFQRKRPPAFKN
ncbi:enoyl-CoA hydratase/carnithine racemase [Psychromicrobium silvestre]|uniref:Enoyl-CoA hydratase/carnithine racemase n=1 Tax=Psychromicrobium silvestre TaxID=1645614 RepID=A0A7Y9LTV0_9MICC|nr:enoyl-CoA hydratase/isomerase family protein [Psychromicrobium silvestre]NYE95503.1 enoyl-CoA hydratase/carnithine racemase [Psychromicrobium silvestre]